MLGPPFVVGLEVGGFFNWLERTLLDSRLTWCCNNYWLEAVGKEMGTIVVIFEILKPNVHPSPGWT